MKNDYVRRIDQRPIAPGKRAAAVPTSSGTGLPYSVNLSPNPLTIPVSLETGKLHPGWLPDYAPSSGNGDSSSGQTYVAPWVRLLQPVAPGMDTIQVSGNGLTVGDNVALAHASTFVELAKVIGGPVSVGEWYEYTLSRSNEQRSYPTGAQVYNLGQDDDGGYVTIVSGDQAGHLQAPHINLWAYEDGTAVRKVRLGLLSGLSAGEKALFPAVTDWNRYSLYADDAFLKGQINATSGNITGDLDVSGTLGVWSGLGRAGVVLGESEGGHGITLQNKEGRPVFAAISPYEDTDGTLNEVALYIEHEGEKGLYYHKNAATGEYQLDIGVNTLVDGTLRATNILAGSGTYPGAFTGMRFGAEGLQSYGTDFLPQVELDVQDGRLYFGGREGWLDRDGMVIDTRQLAQGTDALDHTIRWIRQTNMIESGWRVGAAIGSEADALFATSRTYYGDLGIPNADPNQFYQAELWLQAGPNDTTYLTAPNVEIRGDTSSALTVGRLNPVRAALDGAGRFSAPRLTVGGNVLHVTDDGATVAIGSNTATGAKVISESDTMAQFRGQRSDGQYVALTAAPNAEAWVSASGSLVLAPAAGQTGQKYVLPSADQTIALGSQARKFSAVYAQNGHFGTLGSQTALAGQFYLTHKHATLKVNLEMENTTAYVLEGDLLEGEFYRFEDVDGNWEVVRINTAGTPTGDGWYEHEVERQQGADLDNGLGLARQWYAGDVGVSLGGNAQDGYIRLWGADDQNPNTGPAIVIMQRDNDDNPNSVSERAVFGNLNGWYGYGENKYGVAFGTHTGRWVSLDENEGLRIMEGDQQQAVYREYVQIGRPDGNNVFITDSTLALRVGETAYIDMDNAGNMDLTGTMAIIGSGMLTWANGRGVLSLSGIQYTFNSNNYWSLKENDYGQGGFLNIKRQMSQEDGIRFAAVFSAIGDSYYPSPYGVVIDVIGGGVANGILIEGAYVGLKAVQGDHVGSFIGIEGIASDNNIGIRGRSDNGQGVVGIADGAITGQVIPAGIYGEANHSDGIGVIGKNTVVDGTGVGIYGEATGIAIKGIGTGDNSHGVWGETTAEGGVAIYAQAVDGAVALAISGGIVNGGNQRYTNLADATDATDALNRQTGDLRYGRRWRHWMEAA